MMLRYKFHKIMNPQCMVEDYAANNKFISSTDGYSSAIIAFDFLMHSLHLLQSTILCL